MSSTHAESGLRSQSTGRMRDNSLGGSKSNPVPASPEGPPVVTRRLRKADQAAPHHPHQHRHSVHITPEHWHSVQNLSTHSIHFYADPYQPCKEHQHLLVPGSSTTLHQPHQPQHHFDGYLYTPAPVVAPVIVTRMSRHEFSHVPPLRASTPPPSKVKSRTAPYYVGDTLGEQSMAYSDEALDSYSSQSMTSLSPEPVLHKPTVHLRHTSGRSHSSGPTPALGRAQRPRSMIIETSSGCHCACHQKEKACPPAAADGCGSASFAPAPSSSCVDNSRGGGGHSAAASTAAAGAVPSEPSTESEGFKANKQLASSQAGLLRGQQPAHPHPHTENENNCIIENDNNNSTAQSHPCNNGNTSAQMKLRSSQAPSQLVRSHSRGATLYQDLCSKHGGGSASNPNGGPFSGAWAGVSGVPGLGVSVPRTTEDQVAWPDEDARSTLNNAAKGHAKRRFLRKKKNSMKEKDSSSSSENDSSLANSSGSWTQSLSHLKLDLPRVPHPGQYHSSSAASQASQGSAASGSHKGIPKRPVGRSATVGDIGLARPSSFSSTASASAPRPLPPPLVHAHTATQLLHRSRSSSLKLPPGLELVSPGPTSLPVDCADPRAIPRAPIPPPLDASSDENEDRVAAAGEDNDLDDADNASGHYEVLRRQQKQQSQHHHQQHHHHHNQHHHQSRRRHRDDPDYSYAYDCSLPPALLIRYAAENPVDNDDENVYEEIREVRRRIEANGDSGVALEPPSSRKYSNDTLDLGPKSFRQLDSSDDSFDVSDEGPSRLRRSVREEPQWSYKDPQWSEASFNALIRKHHSTVLEQLRLDHEEFIAPSPSPTGDKDSGIQDKSSGSTSSDPDLSKKKSSVSRVKGLRNFGFGAPQTADIPHNNNNNNINNNNVPKNQSKSDSPVAPAAPTTATRKLSGFKLLWSKFHSSSREEATPPPAPTPAGAPNTAGAPLQGVAEEPGLGHDSFSTVEARRRLQRSQITSKWENLHE